MNSESTEQLLKMPHTMENGGGIIIETCSDSDYIPPNDVNFVLGNGKNTSN
jgi:hypothetical protein